MSRARVTLLAFGVASCVLTACGPQFDTPDKLRSVRVLGLKKEAVKDATGKAYDPPFQAYAKPGDTMALSILVWDGSAPVDEQPCVIDPQKPCASPPGSDAGTPKALHVTWIPGCVNPAGDLYYGCYEQFAQLKSAPGPGTSLPSEGPTTEVKVPGDIITSRPAPEGADPYGLSYVFFTVCPGHLGAAPAGSAGLPIVCYDDDGAPMDADSFVPGFTSIYAYDDRPNLNPLVTDLTFDGQAITPGGDPVTVDRCTASDSVDCQKYNLKAIVLPESAEVDPESLGPNGDTLGEAIWVDYYATAGELDHPTRLVNDATNGWNGQNDTGWSAPAAPGPVELFAVVHDNRGGQAWVQRRVNVR